MNTYHDKSENLLKMLDEYTKKDVIVAFSGGVDSSLLLKIACEQAEKNGTSVHAVTLHTRLHPLGDLKVAESVAKETGALHKIIRIDELEESGIQDNPVNRCYLCKKTLFKKLIDFANEINAGHIIEGTNEDDLHEYRPGIQALKELDIISPLADCGLTKADIRRLAKEKGISVADRPGAPCLATRFPYGTRLSYERMEQIEAAEGYIRSLGFYNVRVRVHDGIARIEVDDRDILRLCEFRNDILSRMKENGFDYITIDLEGFKSGSMDKNLIK